MGLFDFLKKKKAVSSGLPRHNPNHIVETDKSNEVKIHKPEKPKKNRHCALCGEKVDKPLKHRDGFNFYICNECETEHEKISKFELIDECYNCGFNYFRDSGKWDKTKCIVCGEDFNSKPTYEKLIKILSKDYVRQQEATDITEIIKKSLTNFHNENELILTYDQKINLYLKMIELPTFYTAHAFAKLQLQRVNNPDDRIIRALGVSAQKAELGVKAVKNALEGLNKPISPPHPQKQEPLKMLTIQDMIDNANAQKLATSQKGQAGRPSPENWLKDLQSLPIDMSYKNESQFVYQLSQIVSIIQEKIDAPSMRSTFLNMSPDRRAFIIGYTDTHRHEIRRTDVFEYAIFTESLS